ncbi:type IV toxin-antitoxin system AbiEi family antitoxin [Microbacterium hominis]|uniref:type IV toxin-antitoxin system AbiEi family antitoxin n=1 Tax=Microbacterium hominis TaxID=162426 RepID=UPI0012FE9F27|nr:type IV toxin-antitoxin system AbiEi family antitoxin [Microbacterium hominis]
MVDDTRVLRQFEAAPLRALRLRDVKDDDKANTWRTIERLVDRGALRKLTHGVYVAPPGGRDAHRWRPTLEAAALAVATARHGVDDVALTGISAARHWAAVPRAIGEATVAVPAAGYAPITLETGGRVRFVPRDMERLDLIREDTELGRGLVTTPEQTLFDLLMRKHANLARDEVDVATRNLAARANPADYQHVLRAAKRVNQPAKAMLEWLGRDVHVG